MFVNRHQKAAAECGGFHLYKQYFLIQLKSAMQYKTSFFLTCIGQFLVSFNVFIGIYFMFQRFHTVKGYSYNEVLLCFGITLMEFGLAECFAGASIPLLLSSGTVFSIALWYVPAA